MTAAEEHEPEPGEASGERWADGLPVTPHALLAERLDGYTSELGSRLELQPTEDGRERCLDLMVGLTCSADALRALTREDPDDLEDAAEQLNDAVRHLSGVRTDPAQPGT